MRAALAVYAVIHVGRAPTSSERGPRPRRRAAAPPLGPESGEKAVLKSFQSAKQDEGRALFAGRQPNPFRQTRQKRTGLLISAGNFIPDLLLKNDVQNRQQSSKVYTLIKCILSLFKNQHCDL